MSSSVGFLPDLKGRGIRLVPPVKKQDAMEWMQQLDAPDAEALTDAVVPKPADHSGSTMPDPITRVRIDGDPEFVEEFAKFLSDFLEFEGVGTRLSLNLQQVEDRESGELQDDVYALYLSVAERQ